MINDGQLLLGDPCYPQTLINYTIKQRSETTVYGRKIQGLEIRKASPKIIITYTVMKKSICPSLSSYPSLLNIKYNFQMNSQKNV